MSRGTKAYNDVTGRPVSVKVQEFVARMEERFGEERVEAGILAEGYKGDFNHILGRVSDRLSLENQRGNGSAPRELTRPEVMALVRGELSVRIPFTYDSRGLSAEEYTEVLKWADARRG